MTPQKDRARTFGLIGVAFGLGFVLGPALDGLLAGIDIRLPFWASAAAAPANAAFGWCCRNPRLPERRMAPSKRANPAGASSMSA